MPINNYDGDTFVAFLDISGFKELMRNEKKAWNALDRLYQSGYEILKNQNNECRVEGIFISDSGVLFVRRNNRIMPSTSESLKSLLVMIKRINERMRENDFMLTTSIAYGKFRYQERIEFEGIEKNPIYGNAYVSAFLDNENGKPKIQSGQCRIVKKNLPVEINNVIEHNHTDEILRMVKERKGDNKHYYYYWMVNTPEEISRFEQQYRDAYILKYAGMLKALKGNLYGRHIR
ncbi:MAG TPA: hypothetical protein EYP21_02835 [Syntrophaceae bacterium]|nr:hypothetical protein [Syntrophaceae bacterium]